MKARNLFCYALDLFGLLALAGAAGAIAGFMLLAPSAHDLTFLAAFRFALIAAVAAFLVSRVSEILTVFLSGDTPAKDEPVAVTASNVTLLPKRKRFSRAA